MSDLELQLARRTQRLNQLEAQWVRGPTNTSYRGICWAWLLASFARLTLLEAAHGWWWAATILLLVGAVGLVRYGGRVWWLLSLVGLAWPYFFLRDWMTQSLVMMLIAVAGASTISARGSGIRVAKSAHWVAASTYFAAALHKLNAGFFDAQYSCANYGWTKLAAFFDSAIAAPVGGPGVALAVVTTEIAVGLFLLLRPRWGIILGLLFHVPLTMVLAPAFVFVMGIGYAAALGDEDWRLAGELWRAHRGFFVLPALALLFPLLGEADLVLTVKIALLSSAIGTVFALEVRRAARPAPKRAGPLPFLLVAAFALNSLTPYVGTQYQHTGAMLSNLRIDDGCWNHLFMPEPALGSDPYLRIDFASMGPAPAPGEPRPFADREATLTDTLWQVSSLSLLQQNWCRPHTDPIVLRGTFQGEAIHIENLCTTEIELEGVGLFGGTEWLPTFLKFQKNLVRECPTECIH